MEYSTHDKVSKYSTHDKGSKYNLPILVYLRQHRELNPWQG